MNYKYLDPYIDSEDDVRRIRQKCIDLIAEGKTLISWSSEGSSGTKQALIPIGDLLTETKYFLRDITGQYPADSVKVYFV